MIVDLPSLISIVVGNYSFSKTRSVILESRSKCTTRIAFRYSKSTIRQATIRTVLLPLKICTIEVNFEYRMINMIPLIDVSSILADLVQIQFDSDS